MTRVGRVMLAAAVLGGLAALPGLAGAQTTLRYAHVGAEGEAQTRYAAELAELVRQKTAGRVDIRVFPGSQLGNISEMVNAFNSGITAKAAGIAVCLVDLKAFNAPTDRALKAGIPVLSYNADAKNNRLGYIGQDLYLSGFEMGRRIVDLVKSGEVALFIATPGQLNIQPRIDGAQAAIKQLSKGAIKATAIATGADLNGELAKIDAYYLGHKDLKGMFAVDAGSTQGVAQTMQKYGLAKKGVKAGGYDLLPTILRLIQLGHMDFTIDQQPYLQGFYPVMQLFWYRYSSGLVAPSDTNTGILFVTKANVKPYLTTKTRYEGSSSAQKYPVS